jgi:hypothetical protein
VQQKLAELSELAGSIRADRQQVASAAKAIGPELDAWAQEIQSSPVNLDVIDTLMRSYVQTYQRGVQDLSEAMLVYDSLATLQQTRLDTLALNKQAPDSVDEAITSNLAQMYTALTKEDASPIAEITRLQSMTTLLGELADLLQQREASP